MKYWVLSAVVLVVISIGLATMFNRSPIPSPIKRQTDFLIFLPAGNNQFLLIKNSFSFDPKNRVLLMHFQRPSDKRELVVSQQATPSSFNDIPQYLPSLVDKLHSYSSFESAEGKVWLTRPDELKGGQSAIFSGRGTLMFVHPSKNLTDAEWRQFFNNLKPAK